MYASQKSQAQAERSELVARTPHKDQATAKIKCVRMGQACNVRGEAMNFSIFSHTPNKLSQNSAELHRLDVTGSLEFVGEVTDYLREEGHQIDDCLEYSEEQSGQRRYRRIGQPQERRQ
jgi:hypothetical protein